MEAGRRAGRSSGTKAKQGECFKKKDYRGFTGLSIAKGTNGLS